MTGSLAHDELPLPDYDHITVGYLPARIAPLTAGQVEQLLSYEREHGNRLPIVRVLELRIEALEGGAQPSGSVETAAPEQVPGVAKGSGVSPAHSGPPMNPPSHGVPTNPAQPR